MTKRWNIHPGLGGGLRNLCSRRDLNTRNRAVIVIVKLDLHHWDLHIDSFWIVGRREAILNGASINF